jgi:nitrate/nitrite-specific signal transduction histidine kinase
MFRNSPYSALVRAYPSQISQLAAIVENEEKERNFETVSFSRFASLLIYALRLAIFICLFHRIKMPAWLELYTTMLRAGGSRS